MIYIVPFCRRSDVCRYDWLKSGESVKIIVPHPKLADGVRSMGERHRPDLNIESTTIADFIKNEISRRNHDITIYKKYQLVIELSTVWKKCFPSGTYDEFFGAFDGFTRLRGTTMNFDLVEDILDHSHLGLSERDVEGIKKFWKYLDIRGIYDEHAACSYLAGQYAIADGQESSEKMIVYGFSHLSSGQCDLLNAMGESHDIHIPIHAELWREAGESDWVKWINAEVLPVPANERKSGKTSLVKIRSNGLGGAIRQLAEVGCQDREIEIVLAQKNPDFFHIGELAWGEIYFKVDVSVFDNSYTKIFNELEDRFDWKGEVATDSVLKFLGGMVKEELDKNFDEKDFKIIKMASFVCDEIEEWMDLSEDNSVMTMFDYHVFKNSLKLNLPRNYILPRSDKKMRARVKGFEDIEAIGTDSMTIICVTANYNDIDPKEEHWTEKMIESFLKIGPVKRKEFEFKMLKESIMDILVGGDSFLVIEEGLIDENPLWSEILSKIDVDEIFLEKYKKKEKMDYIKSLGKKSYSPSSSGKWSSGKIQKYLDCPRSFYYSYIERIHFAPENRQEVEATELGSLQHKVIRSFLEQFDSPDEREHHNLTKKIWDQFLEEKKLFLDDLSCQNYFIEIKNYSWHGIECLLGIKDCYPETTFSFEVEFCFQDHKGSIDCIINLGDGVMGIVDFKRSEAGIPGKGDTFGFKKIQLWYYMHNFQMKDFRSCFFGYVCLAEPEKSQFVFDEDVFSKSEFGEIFSVGKKYSCSFREKREQFGYFLKEEIENILENKDFLPIPQSDKICNYCWMRQVCIKDGGAINADSQ